MRFGLKVTGLMAVAVVVALGVATLLSLRSDVDDLELRLAETHRELTDVTGEAEALSERLGQAEAGRTDDGSAAVARELQVVRNDQAHADRRVGALASELETLSVVVSEMSSFLNEDLRLSRVDRYVLEGCVEWTVDQIRRMADGFQPELIPPNDCRLLG